MWLIGTVKLHCPEARLKQLTDLAIPSTSFYFMDGNNRPLENNKGHLPHEFCFSVTHIVKATRRVDAVVMRQISHVGYHA